MRLRFMAIKKMVTIGLRNFSFLRGSLLCRPSLLSATRHVSRRTLSTDLITVETDPDNKDVAIVKMNRKPVNGLNRHMTRDIEVVFKELEKTSRGVILTSAVKNVFAAGLDITELYQTTPERFGEFWSSLQDMWMTMYGSPLVTIAAINGHSPAAGCVLAMSCDYRIMTRGKYRIGLNETQLGMVANPWVMDLMKQTIGNRESEKALSLGKLYTCDQALEVGLVDELCDPDNVLDQARAEMDKWLKVADEGRRLTKSMLRKDTIDKLASTKRQDIDDIASVVLQEPVQKLLGNYLESLKKKSK
ncbi:enoyl-CoA delta isomerase 1, mitochondrial-like [Ptychodera flava]|uniref:enoyl-CoA delta isomerase 1, mitochondrial-like n=1 Tax=Ptychodera flava TaxID=63121 RepID=UPI00396A3A7B